MVFHDGTFTGIVSLDQGYAPVRIELKMHFKFQFKYNLNLSSKKNENISIALYGALNETDAIDIKQAAKSN